MPHSVVKKDACGESAGTPATRPSLLNRRRAAAILLSSSNRVTATLPLPLLLDVVACMPTDCVNDCANVCTAQAAPLAQRKAAEPVFSALMDNAALVRTPGGSLTERLHDAIEQRDVAATTVLLQQVLTAHFNGESEHHATCALGSPSPPTSRTLSSTVCTCALRVLSARHPPFATPALLRHSLSADMGCVFATLRTCLMDERRFIRAELEARRIPTLLAVHNLYGSVSPSMAQADHDQGGVSLALLHRCATRIRRLQEAIFALGDLFVAEDAWGLRLLSQLASFRGRHHVARGSGDRSTSPSVGSAHQQTLTSSPSCTASTAGRPSAVTTYAVGQLLRECCQRPVAAAASESGMVVDASSETAVLRAFLQSTNDDRCLGFARWVATGCVAGAQGTPVAGGGATHAPVAGDGGDVALGLNLPLHLAAHAGNVACVEMILSLFDGNDTIANETPHSVRLEDVLATRNALGATPLWLAASKGHASVCLMLLSRGARSNTCNRAGTPAIEIAVQSGFRDVVRHLLEHGADVTEKLLFQAQRFDARISLLDHLQDHKRGPTTVDDTTTNAAGGLQPAPPQSLSMADLLSAHCPQLTDDGSAARRCSGAPPRVGSDGGYGSLVAWAAVLYAAAAVLSAALLYVYQRMDAS